MALKDVGARLKYFLWDDEDKLRKGEQDEAEAEEEAYEEVPEEEIREEKRERRSYTFNSKYGNKTQSKKSEPKYSGPRMARDDYEEESGYTGGRQKGLPKICIARPKTINDAKSIGDEMRKGSIVLIDLENTLQTDKQRVVDCTYGISYGMKYNFVPVLLDTLYVCAPEGTEVTGEGIKMKDGEFYHW